MNRRVSYRSMALRAVQEARRKAPDERSVNPVAVPEPGFRSGRGATAPKRDFPFTFPDCYAQQELM
jgi:hypothetical protein